MKEKMSIHEFIKYTKENPLKFISYCEIILDKLGYVYLAIPSHQEKLIELYCEKYHMTRDSFINSDCIMVDLCLPSNWIIDKEGYISIWYNNMLSSRHINKFQKRSIDMMIDEGLLNKAIYYRREITNEYHGYLMRKKYLVDIYNG